MPQYNVSTGVLQNKRFCNKMRTFLQLRWFLLFPFSFFFWSFFYQNKRQRKINFVEPLDMPYYNVSAGVLQNKKSWIFFLQASLRNCIHCVHCDDHFFIFKKDSVTRCVPSTSSGDFCFFLFRLSFGVSSTRTKSNERSISQNRFICHH